MKIVYRFIVTMLALVSAGAARADNALPPVNIYGGVGYVSGGIGLDESDAIKAAEKDFTLSLLFVQTRRGEYLSDVKVGIKDKAGKTVLEAVADGPMLLARLPAGEYRVSAESGGSTQVKTLRIGDKGVARAAFIWQATAKATLE
jgi:hypothetical protein